MWRLASSAALLVLLFAAGELTASPPDPRVWPPWTTLGPHSLSTVEIWGPFHYDWFVTLDTTRLDGRLIPILQLANNGGTQ